ncbi:hypothetical protein MPSEU_000470900 [Mayamaea pseudoterrestris]|nr:hypothetical protein MPSEU_000470900 [Mayamaea pseudoterrestris]
MTATLNKPNIQELLKQSKEDIVTFLGGVYEHSPWVAEAFITTGKPHSAIESVSDLAKALKSIVEDACQVQKLNLLNAHPDLCEKVGNLQSLSLESREEQSNSGLQSLTADELERFTQFNTAYREKNKFPFILAVRNATKYTVLAALAGRTNNSYEVEFATALTQVHKIAWMRLLTKIDLSCAKGFLTCHVLDTANGCPANNMRIQLHRLWPPESAGLIGEFTTNDDGRLTSGPVLKGGNELLVGTYEWTFHVGDYFASKGTHTTGIPFLDLVPIRFGIDNPDDHYHVPLLVSPWSLSTYRGS